MPESKDEELKCRWEVLRNRFLQSGMQHRRVEEVCGPSGWFKTRGNERLADFANLPWEQLQRIPGFGQKKIARLMKIMTLGLRDRGSEPIAPRVEKPNILEALEEIGVPREFPLHLSHFSARVLAAVAAINVTTAGQLLSVWEKLGPVGLSQYRNVGGKSVAEIGDFFYATERLDGKRLAEIFPLRVETRGVFLEEGILLIMRRLSATALLVLRRRLCENQTLESAGAAFGVSRIRVHQFECNLQAAINALLDWFQAEKETLLFDFENGPSGKDFFGQIADPSERIFAERAVRRLFLQPKSRKKSCHKSA